MISVHQFKHADIQSKSCYLNGNGVYLDICIHKDNAIVALYGLHGYYVEVCYEKESNMINKIKCFTSLKKLDPFLKQVNIDEIILLLKEI
jgi:hypothetical protein